MTQPPKPTWYDAIVVGSGPNGLAAAITLARAGWRVLLVEAKSTVGGGMRTAEVTLPGFHHDLCSAIHPLGMGSPFFQTLPLADFGLEWLQPELPVAHPLADGTAVALHRSLDTTAAALGVDGSRWRTLFAPVVAEWERLAPMLLGPLPLPRHPLALGQMGLRAVWPATFLANRLFREERAKALFAGMAAHAILPLEEPLTAAFGLMLGALGHVVGWPLPRGGSQQIANALAAYFQSLGGEIVLDHQVATLAELPPARAVLLDLTPRQVLQIAGDQLPDRYHRQLERYRYGMGVFKIDYALAGPVPWRAAECRRAGTVHLGGTLAEIAAGERAIAQGRHPERPYVLVAQQSLFDARRAPAGRHTLWAYCHVPNGSTVDMTGPIEAQIERFAPGFQELVLARHTTNTVAMERYNANYIGGDINGGRQDLRQFWTRPVPRLNPYATPVPGLYLCSSATPPGGGVHGMCGYHAALAVLRHFG
ncbi:MAG: NAD(P)/FAD-dependent oxidoreductase [Caldilineaceae bacterium]|nr:NAD(P)/FAD-dependent oxidoreductase [Caldilineaceae bacterium]